MITLSIQSPVIPPKAPVNMYELTVRSYHGDGDKDEESVLRFKSNAEDLEQLHVTLEILEAYIKAEKPYMVSQDEWEQFIIGQNIDTECITYISDHISELLAWDVTTDGQYLTTFSGYDLKFYDYLSVKRNVIVGYTNGNN